MTLAASFSKVAIQTGDRCFVGSQIEGTSQITFDRLVDHRPKPTSRRHLCANPTRRETKLPDYLQTNPLLRPHTQHNDTFVQTEGYCTDGGTKCARLWSTKTPHWMLNFFGNSCFANLNRRALLSISFPFCASN